MNAAEQSTSHVPAFQGVALLAPMPLIVDQDFCGCCHRQLLQSSRLHLRLIVLGNLPLRFKVRQLFYLLGVAMGKNG